MVVSVPVQGGRWHIIPQLAVYTTYIPLIVLAFWGVKNATDPTFYGNQRQPLNVSNVPKWNTVLRLQQGLAILQMFILSEIQLSSLQKPLRKKKTIYELIGKLMPDRQHLWQDLSISYARFMTHDPSEFSILRGRNENLSSMMSYIYGGFSPLQLPIMANLSGQFIINP